MLRREQEGIEWLEFELFIGCRKLKAAVFLRKGGISSGPYSSLNLSYHTGDDPTRVEVNLTKVCTALRLPNIVWGKQVHGTHLERVSSSAPSIPCDGLFTIAANLGLLIHHADCQAAIFYDPIHNAVANVHCGWRGSVQNIYSVAVQHMREAFSTRPEELLVGISPSLGPENSQFIHYQQEFPETFWPFQFKPNYFDLWALSEWQLQECGILPHHIQIARIDTYAHPEEYFSYRRDKIRGGNGTVVMLH